jgi:hypothetical protein
MQEWSGVIGSGKAGPNCGEGAASGMHLRNLTHQTTPELAKIRALHDLDATRPNERRPERATFSMKARYR